tara:strand:- start:1645 stop:1956 length:312 start_codon:yes stop_codon:yes gene_type:complete
MKATIKLQEVTKLSLGTELAIFSVTLEHPTLLNFHKVTFSMSSTGMSLRVTSEHSTFELIKFCEWLKDSSKDNSNLRDNESELRLFAKDMIKTNKKLNKSKTI